MSCNGSEIFLGQISTNLKSIGKEESYLISAASGLFIIREKFASSLTPTFTKDEDEFATNSNIKPSILYFYFVNLIESKLFRFTGA